MKSKSTNVDAATLVLYDKLVAATAGIDRKGDTVPYTSLNGHMFSYINKEDGQLIMRLPEGVREEFMTKYKTTNPMSYGIVMKEYVSVPADLLKKTNELKKYFAQSVAYINTLKPKPTKKAAVTKTATKKTVLKKKP